mmetsp:Transcript_14665/g.58631  ORF Transcript_14665/g.58631 Transcript_14665/m.58631 type:complete len:284 (-) Transcript_14665:38-889(-)
MVQPRKNSPRRRPRRIRHPSQTTTIPNNTNRTRPAAQGGELRDVGIKRLEQHDGVEASLEDVSRSLGVAPRQFADGHAVENLFPEQRARRDVVEVVEQVVVLVPGTIEVALRARRRHHRHIIERLCRRRVDAITVTERGEQRVASNAVVPHRRFRERHGLSQRHRILNAPTAARQVLLDVDGPLDGRPRRRLEAGELELGRAARGAAVPLEPARRRVSVRVQQNSLGNNRSTTSATPRPRRRRRQVPVGRRRLEGRLAARRRHRAHRRAARVVYVHVEQERLV